MQIESRQEGQILVLELKGRLDANWSEHVSAAIEGAIRAGNHEINLDLRQVDYLSSAGISVLLKYYRRLADAKGRLRVCNATGSVLSVLNLTRITGMLTDSPAKSPAGSTSSSESVKYERDGVAYESHALPGSAPLNCLLFGDPDQLGTSRLKTLAAEKVRVNKQSFCLGLGAFGESGTDASNRFGEALGIAGVAIQQAPDGSSVPDFQICQGDLIPELQLLYGLQGSGDFSRLIRFEASQSEQGKLPFSKLIAGVLGDLQTDAAAFAILAESEIVIGASLIRSPALAVEGSLWDFPKVRDWLTFTSEQTDESNLVLIVGIACTNPSESAHLFLRPFGAGSETVGHFHAAVFPYRPLPKGMLNLASTIAGILAVDSARSVLHLVADDRPFEGVGETELMRGACWCGPLKDVSQRSIATGSER